MVLSLAPSDITLKQSIIIFATQTSSNSPPAGGSSRRTFFWHIAFGAAICDLLGLCHLIPSHSQHLYRPYMLSMVKFKVFRNKN